MAYFDKYGVEFSDDCKTLIRCPEDIQGEYIIPEGVDYIESWAFCGCKNLSKITISKTISSFGMSPFFECDSLKEIIWNAEQCNVFRSFGSPLKSLDETLVSIVFGEQVKHIPRCICLRMHKLQSVNLQNGVVSIGENAFCGCTELISVSLPRSIVSIGDGAFSDCGKLSSIDIDPLNENYHVVDNVLTSKQNPSTLLSNKKEVIEPRTKKSYFISLIIIITIAFVLLIGIVGLYGYFALRDDDYIPMFWMGGILFVGIYVLYKHMKGKYDKKMALVICIPLVICVEIIRILLSCYSLFAAVITDMIALTLILGVIIGFILHKNLVLSKEEYEKLKD